MTCLKAARKRGRIVQVGTLPAEGVLFPANCMARELDDVGAFRAAHTLDWAWRDTCAPDAWFCG